MAELPYLYWEVEEIKRKISLNLPIHMGVFMLNYAKLRMLQFYHDFINYELLYKEFHMLEMDTDSDYLGITVKEAEDLIEPELKEQFEYAKKGL